MPDRRHRGRQLRDVFITLALIFLVGAGATYGATRYPQSGLESDATRDARKLSVDVLQPLLVPADAQGPVQGARYDELLSAVDERVLAGPINGVLLLAQDGTVLFADQPSLVGDHEPALRDDIHAVIAGTSQSSVDGARFRTLTALEIGSPPTLVAAELVRSHPAIVEESREVWYPWVGRAIIAAIVCFGLALVTAIVFAVIGCSGAVRRGNVRRVKRHGCGGRRRAPTRTRTRPHTCTPVSRTRSRLGVRRRTSSGRSTTSATLSPIASNVWRPSSTASRLARPSDHPRRRRRTVRIRSARVALDLSRISNPRLVRVHPGVAPGPALVQEVPTLIEGDLELLEALAFGLVGLAARLRLPELVLLVRQLVDPLDDLLVVHVGSHPRSGPPRYDRLMDTDRQVNPSARTR